MYDGKRRGRALYFLMMALLGLKLWENAFQTIPNISFFDVENKNWRKFSIKLFVKKCFRRKIDKLPVFAELWIFGRNRQMRLEKLPPKFCFSTLYDFWRRGKRDSFDFCPRLSAKLTSTLFVFWLEDTCVPDDKIPEIAWTAHKGGSYLAVTPLLREGGLISRPRGVLMDRHRGDFN